MSVLYKTLFRVSFYNNPGIHLLSHAVSSIVPSAAQVLTVVFGMGTSVSPKRIGTRNLGTFLSKIQQCLKPLLFYSVLVGLIQLHSVTYL